MRLRLIFILSFFISFSVNSQDFNKQKLDSLFSLIEDEQQGMGSISIFDNGIEVYQRAFGYADIKSNTKANSETTYRIGSISKTFTSTMVMQLVEEEKLELGTKLDKFFPEIPNASDITIEHLLRHRSGLYNFTNAPEYINYMEGPKSRSELLDIFIGNGTVFKPDAKFEYSNTNYVLLSFILEEIDQDSYDHILVRHIVKPLKLEHTYYGGKIASEKNEAFSYQKLDSWVSATETDMSIPSGAGAIVSSPTDLNIFFNALFNGELVNEKSLNLMKKMVDGYGLGLIQIPFYEKRAYGHNGGIDGFMSNAAYFPDDNVSLAYTTNGVGMAMNDVLIGALSIYYSRTYDLPTFEAAIVLKSEDLDKYLGVYSSKQLPLKLTVSKNGNQLRCQATGQSAFPLEAYEADNFRFTPAGIKIEFSPNKDKLVLNQGGMKYEYSKEE